MSCTKEATKKLNIVNIECRNCYTHLYVEKKDCVYKCSKCGYEEELEVLNTKY